MSEIKDIMDLLGRGITEGQIRGSHLGQILMYLQQKRTESLKLTLGKLALICGMSKRNVKENYIEGIEGFGIIKTAVIHNDVIWTWVGIKAFENDNMSFMEWVNQKKQKEKEKNREKKENGKDKR